MSHTCSNSSVRFPFTRTGIQSAYQVPHVGAEEVGSCTCETITQECMNQHYGVCVDSKRVGHVLLSWSPTVIATVAVTATGPVCGLRHCIEGKGVAALHRPCVRASNVMCIASAMGLLVAVSCNCNGGHTVPSGPNGSTFNVQSLPAVFCLAKHDAMCRCNPAIWDMCCGDMKLLISIYLG